MDNSEPENLSETKHRRQWPVRKILAIFFVSLLIFGAGVEVGEGRLHIGEIKADGERSSLPMQLDYSSVNQVYSLLKTNFDGNLDKDQLLDGLKTGLVNATGDPYTNYFNPKEAKEFDQELSGSFTGIGAELGSDASNNIVIVSPLSGYPAEKAGLQPKDIIAAVDGQSTSGMSVDSVVKKIRGAENTKVKLTVIRDSGTPFDIEITRTKITVASVESHVDGNIGYLKISQFGPDTVDLSQKAAADFKKQGVKGIVLDLRGNPGGYLSGAVDVSSMWLSPGNTVVSERKDGKVQNVDHATALNPLKGIPTVVLINGGSASASEITAGALHDNKAATLVGEKSFGKGSVQQVICLSAKSPLLNLNSNSNSDQNCDESGGELKVTVAHWYTPGGKNINKQGISPDVSVTNTDDDVKNQRDPQKDKAYEILQSKIQ